MKQVLWLTQEEAQELVDAINAELFPDSPKGRALVQSVIDRPGVLHYLDEVVASQPRFLKLPVKSRLALMAMVTEPGAAARKLYEPKYILPHAALMADGCDANEALRLIPKGVYFMSFNEEIRLARNVPMGALRAICAPRRVSVEQRRLALRMMDGLKIEDLAMVLELVSDMGKAQADEYLRVYRTLRGAALRAAATRHVQVPTEVAPGVTPGTISKAHGALFRLACEPIHIGVENEPHSRSYKEPYRRALVQVAAGRFSDNVASLPEVRRMGSNELLVFFQLMADNPKLRERAALNVVQALSPSTADGVARVVRADDQGGLRIERVAALAERTRFGFSQVRAYLMLADATPKAKLPMLVERVAAIESDDLWNRTTVLCTEFPEVIATLAKELTSARQDRGSWSYRQLEEFLGAQRLVLQPPPPRVMTLAD